MSSCPCGLKKRYLACCGQYISGKKVAPTPETLMRSRYTAFTRNNMNYIERTMTGPALEGFDKFAAEKENYQTTWLGLEVLSFSENETEGTVEFIAYYAKNQKKNKIHEISQFILMNGEWLYVDGNLK